MQIYPAIDLRGGYCVRLRQGDYDQETIFDNDPVAVAQRWEKLGAGWLHLVDLDGAKVGRPVNGATARQIRAAVKIPCQFGGGLREDAHIEEAFSWGVERVVLGTRALKDPHWLRSVCERWPGRIALGLDARSGMVATHGWVETSDRSAVDVAREVAGWPLAAIVYTDIAKDGMLGGPNFEALAELRAAVALPVIASGGVTTVADVKKLARLNLSGCIVGRALYEGRLDLTAALSAIGQRQPAPGPASA
ncbi:MAG: 1-(5-phosphoribosyl)-5-[(5-phosphoribosylamino)methylideneamino]imidazole-4-carboxamide isomerase [Gemmataceae bacterium]